MKSEAVYETITNCIKKLLLGKTTAIKNTDRIEEDLNIDSMSAAELVFSLEEEFCIEISDSELFEMKTVQDIVDLIMSKTEKVLANNCV